MDQRNYGGRGTGGGRGGGRGTGGGRTGGRDGAGRTGGRDGGRGGGRGGGDQYQQQQYNRGGGGGGGGRGYNGNNPTPAQQWPNQPVQGQGGAFRPPAASQGVGPTVPVTGESSARGGHGGGRGEWGSGGPARTWAQATVPDHQVQRTPQPRSDPVTPAMQSLKISEPRPSSSLAQSTEGNMVPIRRPDKGGRNAIRTINLSVNHFPVKFNPDSIIIHYDVEIKRDNSFKGRPEKTRKSDLQLIWNKLCSDSPNKFPLSMAAYDGEKNIFSAVALPTGKFKVEISDGEDTKSRSYNVTLKAVSELKLRKLKDYLCGNVMSVPREILQGMDVIMKDNPSRHNISVGRSFFRKEWGPKNDLRGGNVGLRGFQQSLKPTFQGLALCLDSSVLAFRKKLPVLDYLKECLGGGFNVSDFGRWKGKVTDLLRGLKVTVIHRRTSQKYTITKLTVEDTRNVTFTLEDPEGIIPPTKVGIVEYFLDKYGKDIEHKDIPCLDLGRNNRINYVPMEFCVLAEGQKYPKEHLDKQAALLLKNMSLPPPRDRKNIINEMVRAEDGPCGGNVINNFGLQVIKDMTTVVGRVMVPPELRLGAPNGGTSKIRVDKDKCQWNLVGKRVVDGKPIDRWALIDFSSNDRFNRLDPDRFIPSLINRCRNLGMYMEEPLVCQFTQLHVMSNPDRLQQLLESVVAQAKCKLQIIICVMPRKDNGYKFLKYISETQIGVVTQCCLSMHANKTQDQYLSNLAQKINAKLGGSNAELIERLPRFEGQGHVMFIGADVNHPGAGNIESPSIAAVVGTVNWPAANRYAARVLPQGHRKEKIVNFGSMCLDLVRIYEQHNKVKPDKIVVFRDGVSEGQFDMVLNEELHDLKMALYDESYRPTITLVVAQKRHQTRLFPDNPKDGGATGNVPPGTVVDTTVVHPYDFDFYLCSHYGGLGTSKPTHYTVLYDEHNFSSDQLQKLTYDMCFTFSRCTKPVSLVPPVYYADLAAYRGRLFQEAVMELKQHSSSSSSVGGASFDHNFYKVRPELENFMFFV